MAARRANDGGRLVTAAEQFAPWRYGNNNDPDRSAAKGDSGSAWEREVRKLRAMGIAEEELKVYVREITSPNENVNKLNDQIVAKVNGIAGFRRQWFVLYSTTGDKKDIGHTKARIRELKMQIAKIQAQVRAIGGVWVTSPVLFNSPPKM